MTALPFEAFVLLSVTSASGQSTGQSLKPKDALLFTIVEPEISVIYSKPTIPGIAECGGFGVVMDDLHSQLGRKNPAPRECRCERPTPSAGGVEARKTVGRMCLVVGQIAKFFSFTNQINNGNF
jgi:hypothetical protein